MPVAQYDFTSPTHVASHELVQQYESFAQTAAAQELHVVVSLVPETQTLWAQLVEPVQ